MLKLLSFLVLFLMIVLLIPTGLVLASQNSVPGDSTYPIKRQMEEIILSVLSLHPTTRAYFKVDFSKRRFTETTQLFQRGKGQEAINSLTDLNSQTEQALNDVTNLSDKYKKIEYLNNLLTEVVSRDQKFNELQQKSPVKFNPTPTPFPTSPVGGRLVNPNATPTSIPEAPVPVYRVVPVPVDPGTEAALKQAQLDNDALKKQIQDAKDKATKELPVKPLSRQNTTTPTSTPVPPTPIPTVGAGGGISGGWSDDGVVPDTTAQTRVTPTPVPTIGAGDFGLAGYELPIPTARPPTPTPFVECPDQCYSDQLWVGIHKAGEVCDNTHPDNVYICDNTFMGATQICKNQNYTCNGTYWYK